MTTPTPRELLAQLGSWAPNPPAELMEDQDLRRELHIAARKLQLRLEEPASAVMRLTIAQSTEAAVLRTSYDLGLFPYLAKDDRAKTLDEISTSLKVDPVLLLRILRYLATQGVLLEEGMDGYALSPSCNLLGDATFTEAAKTCDELVSSVFGAVPSFLKEIQYQNPTDRRNGPANKAWGQDDADMYEILKTKFPEHLGAFAAYLGAYTSESAKPHEIYPVRERLIDGFDASINEHLWVDIGGGMGMYTVAVKQAYPEVAGKLIVQEQDVMVHVAVAKGADKQVEFMTHNYFDEQPVKHARAYFLRNILHNLPDREAKQVLTRVHDAMKPGYSRLLIQDSVIPERGATPSEATQDFLMMMGYSSLERSRAQWDGLLQAVGLKISRVYTKSGAIEIIEVDLAN